MTVRGFRWSFAFWNYDKFIYSVKYLLSIEPIFSIFWLLVILKFMYVSFISSFETSKQLEILNILSSLGSEESSLTFLTLIKKLYDSFRQFWSQSNCSLIFFTFSTLPSFLSMSICTFFIKSIFFYLIVFPFCHYLLIPSSDPFINTASYIFLKQPLITLVAIIQYRNLGEVGR